VKPGGGNDVFARVVRSELNVAGRAVKGVRGEKKEKNKKFKLGSKWGGSVQLPRGLKPAGKKGGKAGGGKDRARGGQTAAQRTNSWKELKMTFLGEKRQGV